MDKKAQKRSFLNRTGFRLSLQYLILYSALSVLIFTGTYFVTLYEMKDWALDRMEVDATNLRKIYDEQGITGVQKQIEAFSAFSGQGEFFFGVVDAQGVALTSGFDIERRSELGAVVEDNIDQLIFSKPNEIEGSFGYWFHIEPLGENTLVLGTDKEVVSEFIEALVGSLVAGIILLIAGGLLFGMRVGKITEVRIDEISDTLNSISNGDLDQRISLAGGQNDDLDLVNEKINFALDKLQDLVLSQKQITVDIAHDLRSPLQRLRQRLEKLSVTKNSENDRDVAIQEIDSLVGITHSLLLISEMNDGIQTPERQSVRVAEVLSTLVEVYEDAAHERNQSLQLNVIDQDFTLETEPMLFRQMIANLIENAILHSPSDAKIEVEMTANKNTVDITVSDNGFGIPLGDRERVLKRFVRLDAARNTSGNGLGLALVAAISRYLGASLTMSDNNPGLRIGLCFKRESRAT